MRDIWSEERKFSIWLEIETLACEAMADLGLIPRSDAEVIRAKGRFSVVEIAEIEKRTNHDVIAFLENVAASIGPAARWMHQGLTSSDILDTTLAFQLVQASDLLAAGIRSVRAAAARQAIAHKLTPMIGRSHGIHAEPITFGLKMALMYDEFGRAETRLQRARSVIAVGKLSGAVGTHAHLDPRVEEIVCRRLQLEPDRLSTQIIQRDRHAEFSHLQRTEVGEIEEYFSPGQKGSSAMPHKRNPITGERLSGLARVIRGNAVVALENVALWHERDISHSSAERIILPDSCILLDYMLVKLCDIVEKLQVYPERMAQNLALTKGLYFSQSILLALTRAGAERKSAYEAVQRAAMNTWKGEGTFAENAKREPEIAAKLSASEIDRLCSLDVHFEHVDATFKALGLE